MKKFLPLLAIAGAMMLGSVPAIADWDGDGYYMVQNNVVTTMPYDKDLEATINNAKTPDSIKSLYKRYVSVIGDDYTILYLATKDGYAFKDCIKMCSPIDTNELGESYYHSDPGTVIRIEKIGGDHNLTLAAQGVDTKSITDEGLTILTNTESILDSKTGEYTYYNTYSFEVSAFGSNWWLQDLYCMDLSSSHAARSHFKIKKIDGVEEYFGATAKNKIGDYYYTTLRTAFNYKLTKGMKAFVVADANGTLKQIAQEGEIVNAESNVILQCPGRTAKENQLLPVTDSNSDATYTTINSSNKLQGVYEGTGLFGLQKTANYFHQATNIFVMEDENKAKTDTLNVNQGAAFTSSGTYKNTNYRLMEATDGGNLGFYRTYKTWANATDENIQCMDGNQSYMNITSDLTLIGKPASISASAASATVGDNVTVTIARNADMNASVGWIEYSIDGGQTWIKTDDGKAAFTSKLAGEVTLLARMNNNGVPSDAISQVVTFNPIEAELATIAQDPKVDYSYKVNGKTLTSVAQFTAHDGSKYIVVTDNDQAKYGYVNTTDYANATDLLNEQLKADQKNYTQNNWAVVKVNNDEDFKKFELGVIDIQGRLTDDYNITIDATSVTANNETAQPALNTYVPINFMGSNTVSVTNSKGVENTYFFMTPKRSELAHITWLVYAEDGNFYLPADKAYNPSQIKGGVTPVWDYNVGGQPNLTVGNTYKVDAIVKAKQTSNGVAKRVNPYTAGGVSTLYEIWPINVPGEITAVSDVQATREVQSVSYYDLTGRQSAEPFEGVNVVVTRYTDGTSTACKVLSTK